MVHWVDEWRIGKASNADVEKLTSSQICYSLNRRYATKSRAGVCYWKFIKFYLLILANCNEFWIINWFLVKCLRQSAIDQLMRSSARSARTMILLRNLPNQSCFSKFRTVPQKLFEIFSTCIYVMLMHLTLWFDRFSTDDKLFL